MWRQAGCGCRVWLWSVAELQVRCIVRVQEGGPAAHGLSAVMNDKIRYKSISDGKKFDDASVHAAPSGRVLFLCRCRWFMLARSVPALVEHFIMVARCIILEMNILFTTLSLECRDWIVYANGFRRRPLALMHVRLCVCACVCMRYAH